MIPSRRVLHGLILLACLGLVAVLYAPARFSQFHSDDFLNLEQAKQTLEGQQSILTPVNIHFNPLFNLRNLLSLKFFGLNPAPYFISLIFFHLINVALLYGLSIRLLRDARAGWIAALLYGTCASTWGNMWWWSGGGWHNGLFWVLLAVWMLDLFLDTKRWRWLMLAALAQMMGLFSLSLGYEMPAVVGLYTLAKLSTPWRKRILQACGYALPFVVVIGISFLFRGATGAGSSAEVSSSSDVLTYLPKFFAAIGVNIYEKLILSFSGVYWTRGVGALFEPDRPLETGRLLHGVIAVVALLGAVFVGFRKQVKYHGLLGFLAAWMCLALVPPMLARLDFPFSFLTSPHLHRYILYPSAVGAILTSALFLKVYDRMREWKPIGATAFVGVAMVWVVAWNCYEIRWNAPKANERKQHHEARRVEFFRSCEEVVASEGAVSIVNAPFVSGFDGKCMLPRRVVFLWADEEMFSQCTFIAPEKIEEALTQGRPVYQPEFGSGTLRRVVVQPESDALPPSR